METIGAAWLVKILTADGKTPTNSYTQKILLQNV
jgi:hypothetical protein